MRKTDKLISDVNKKLANWNERSTFTLKGVRNLSRSDMDVLLLYAEHYNQYGSFDGLMDPVGGIKDVLTAYGLIAPPKF